MIFPSELSKEQAKLLRFQLLEEQVVRLARKSASVFSEYVSEYKLCPMQREWNDFFDQVQRGIVVAPRKHGKTSLLTIDRVLWELGRNPDLRIKIVSSSDPRAWDFSKEIAQKIEKNARLRRVFPELQPSPSGRWSATRLDVGTRVRKDASIEAIGVLSSSTGAGADLIVFDDVVDYKNAIKNPMLREAVKKAFYSNWLPMLEGSTARFWFIANVWHEEDLTAELLREQKFPAKVYSIDEDFNPLWEEKYPKEVLLDRFRIMPLADFNRAYRNIALSKESLTFNSEDIEKCKDYTTTPKDWAKLTKFMAVDLALESGNCRTVIFLGGIDKTGVKVPLEIARGNWSSPNTARVIARIYEEWSPNAVYVENNFYQQALIDWMQELYKDIPIIAFCTGKDKMDREMGLPALAVDFRNSLWRIPLGKRHEQDCPCGFCFWLAELSTHPYGKDDAVMASWMFREACRRWASSRLRGRFAVVEL